MITMNTIKSVAQSGGNISDIAHGPTRLLLATKGFQSIAQGAINLCSELDAQFTAFKQPSRIQDIYRDYQQTMSNIQQFAKKATSVIQAAKSQGSLNVQQAKELENLSQKTQNAIAKLKNLKAELIRRRIEGDDEFDDDKARSAPMLLISASA